VILVNTAVHYIFMENILDFTKWKKIQTTQSIIEIIRTVILIIYVVRFVIKFTNKMFTSKTGKGKIMEFMKKEAEGELPILEKGLWKYRNLHSYL
jgi:hypothetical protein